jgi:cellulose 1,4-beta-cellobiosidase
MKKNLINLAVGISIGLGSFSQLAYAQKASATINPFEGAVGYVNPDYVTSVNQFFGKNDTTGDYKKKAIALNLLDGNGNWKIPTGIWLDSKAAIAGEPPRSRALSLYLKDALDNFNSGKTGGKPVILTVVIYDLPLRDCDAYSSNGEFKEVGDLTKYETEYINVIRDAFIQFYQTEKSENVRLALIIEPDSIPNMLTNIYKETGDPATKNCLDAYKNNLYSKGITYALKQFSTIPEDHPNANISMYLDIAHSGWLGWDTNANQIANIYNNGTEVVYYGKDKHGNDIRHLGLGEGFDHVRGFITNTSNYTPLKEAFDYKDYAGNNNNIRNTDFYQWNLAYDENSFVAEIMSLDANNATKNGDLPKFNAKLNADVNGNADITKPPVAPIYAGKHFLIDTSRNGWIVNKGGYLGTRGNGPAYDRRDQRHHRGNWCNAQSIQAQAGYVYDNPGNKATIPARPTSSGLGEYPQAVAKTGMPSLTMNPYYGDNKLPLPIDAFVWIKPPGEGDGSYTPSPESGDQMCGALPYTGQNKPKSGGGSHNDYQLTDALQDNGGPAPHAGKFFPVAFQNLIDSSICSKGIKGFTSPFCGDANSKLKSKSK